MGHSFQGQPVTLFCRRTSAKPFAILAVVALPILWHLPGEVRAQDEQLSTAGSSAQSILVREHAGWNKDCEAIPHPALYLVDPPRHGNVCARIENIKISSMYVGTESQCIGRVVRGVRLIYRPDAAYAGDDGLRYAAQYPSALRELSVKITVSAQPPGTTGAAANIAVAPAQQARQSPGPVPACVDLLF